MHPLKYFDERSYGLVFRWIDKKKVGLIDPEKSLIIINIYLLLVETFVHEQMHDEYPEIKDEVTIEAKARRKIERMTVCEIKELGKKLLEVFLKQEK